MKTGNRICPVCGRTYDTYPALSRKDNKTEICPDCGTQEALFEHLEHSRQQKLTVVVKCVGKEPEVTEIENTLFEMQVIVGGYIEAVYMFDGVVLICDEEGKIKNRPANFKLGRDIVVGDVFFVGTKGEDFTSLTSEQIQTILNSFR